MRFRRVDGRVVEVREEGDTSQSPQSNSIITTTTNTSHDDDVDAAEPSLLASVLAAYPPDPSDPSKRNLPYQPRSYRDFMLFESHYYGAAAGMCAMFLSPVLYLVFRAFTLLTCNLVRFPFFLPPRLWYRQPIWYQSNHLAFVSDGAEVAYPTGDCTYLDVELELGIVLGKELYNAASAEEALAAVAGFAVLNDFSARDRQMEEMGSGFGPQGCKGFANSISGTVVSADELLLSSVGGIGSGRPALQGTITINGQVVSRPRAAAEDWKFSLGQALMHVSQGTRLYAGEFFGSGTLPGGAGLEWSRFRVRVGDEVRLEIEGVGSVTNRIVER